MKYIRSFFKEDETIPKPFKILDLDEDDAFISFEVGETMYSLMLDWEDGELDIEFGILDSEIHDTTGLNHQYQVLNTVSHITRYMAKRIEMETKMPLHSITFKSSNFRKGKVDERSGEIRTKFFVRHIRQLYPNAKVKANKNNIVKIKLDGADE